MRIVAQSTLADGSPYLHLGYTSATTTMVEHVNHAPLIGGGMLASAGLLLLASRLRPSTRRHWWTAGVGVACLALGGGLVLSSLFDPSHERPAYPEEWTQMQQWKLLEAAHGTSNNIHSVQDVPNWHEHGLDAWHREMRLERTPEGKPAFRSAGPDGAWGSADDIVNWQTPFATSLPTTQAALAAQLPQASSK